MSKVSNLVKKVRVIPVKHNQVTRKYWRVVPYKEVIRELKSGQEVFVEGISRQTASHAAQKLSKMLGQKVVHFPALLRLPADKEVLDGYTFEVEGSKSEQSLAQKNTFS